MMFFVAVNEPATPSISSSTSKILSPSLASEIESLSLANDVPTVIAPVSYRMPFDNNFSDIVVEYKVARWICKIFLIYCTVYTPSVLYVC